MKCKPRKKSKSQASSVARRTKAGRAKARRAGASKPAPSKRLSAIDAAAQVLAGSASPMRVADLIDVMKEQGLWSSPNGRTPEATLYAAIFRELATKGSAARFRKVGRGLFAAA